jgi:V/A-type H+-transporting ATPase subunit C
VARLDHVNARIGARRPRLAGVRQLRELLGRGSVEARLELLRSLPAGASLVREPGADPLATAEQALRGRLRSEARELAARVEGRAPRALLEAWLALDEAAEVKAILRGVRAGAAVDRSLAAFPADGALPLGVLRRAAAATSLADAVALLREAGSVVAATVEAALPVPPAPSAEGPAGDRAAPAVDPLPALELAADRAALGRALRACRGAREDGRVLARHLAERVDARNAATLLALDGDPPAASPWLEGGRRWSLAALDALARGGRDAARAAIAEGFGVLAAALAHPVAAERALDRACAAALAREARALPLSLAVPLAYLAARREEIRRIALALRGASLELPPDELLDLVEA